MRLKSYGYYAGCAIAAAVFAFSVGQIFAYYGDIRSSKHQVDAARAIYEEASRTTRAAKADDAKPAPAFVPIPDAANADPGAKSPFAEQASTHAPGPEKLVVQDRFKPLLRTNADVVGWLKIDGTTIDYPVLQAEDNAYYLKKDLYRNDNVTGSIFLDYRNRIDGAAEKHWIVYGHYMKDEIMFKGLLKYMDEAYYAEHPVIAFDTLYGNFKWLIFSAYATNANEDYIRTSFADDAAFGAFADGLLANSLYDTGVSIRAEDTILTLSTCSRTEEGGRFTVHAKLISDPT